MKKSKEEKILQELIDKVIEKDRDIKERHDEEDLRNATYEALHEMTELSPEEIQKIESEIKFAYQKKQKRTIKFILIFAAILLLSAVIIRFVIVPYQFNNRPIFTEEFDSNINGWETYTNSKQKRYIESGFFYFSTKTSEHDKCFKSLMPQHIKKHSKITLSSKWIEGENYYYGLVLQKNSDNYYAFEMKLDGKACFVYRKNGSTELFIDNLKTNLHSTKGISVVQSVLLKGI